jgi:acyl transferase domain-containing protein
MEIKELDSKNIAIIGISGQMALADDLDIYWDNILNKVECVREFPIERQKDVEKYLKFKGIPTEEVTYYQAAFMDQIDQFDPKLFHLTPKEAKLMDPRQRLFLQHAWSAIEDAGYSIKELRGQRIGVYSGFSDFGDETYFDMLSNVDPDSIEMGFSGNLQAIIPSRVSYLLDMKGPSMVVDTACSSSLVAIHLACQALRNKECDSAIVGSVRLHLFPLEQKYRVGFESLDGRTRAFDDSAAGTGVGEGAITIMLKPLAKAKADGNHIYAVIKGSAINQDGNSIGITAPNADAQADVIERAWRDAGVSAEDISYMETHGTGTILGDPIEMDGIIKAFSKHTSKRQFCAIGSVKSNIGHLYEVAGLASVIKCIFALNKKILPPSINYQVPNKAIDFVHSPVYVNTKTREWKSAGKKRVCGISSFGFSGTNCHIVLEEADHVGDTEYEELESYYILPLSGKTKGVMKELVNRYIKDLDQIRTQHPKDVCYTAAVGRNDYNHRMAIIFSDYDQLAEKLEVIRESSLDELHHHHIYYHCLAKDKPASSFEVQLEVEKINNLDLNANNDDEELRVLALAYVHDHAIPWADLYGSIRRRRVKLPTWGFDQARFWIDIPDIATNKVEMQRSVVGTEDLEEIILAGRADGAYTFTEKRLGAIIKKVMEYDKTHIHDNFYELGGDSLLALNIYTRINESFGVNLTVADILSKPSIFLLSQYIDELLANDGKQQIPEKVTISDKEICEEIAIIGMAGRFPQSDNIQQYWENLCEEKHCVSDIPDNRKSDLIYYIRHMGLNEDTIQYIKAGYLREIDKFDYEYFGLYLKEATLMDPIQRGFLEIVYETIEDAGYGGKRLKGSHTGVFVGYTEDYLYSYRKFIFETDPSLTKFALAGNLTANIPGRISYALDLKGPSLVVDTACSSSLVAINTAIKSLRNGECETAIVGSAKIKLIPLHESDGNVGVESHNDMIRAFDDDADGLVEGESICAVMLKPLKQAIADGDHIRAVLKGSAVNQDGTGMGIMAPRSETETQVIVDAWKDAGIGPTSISYIETHGTGTRLGDLVEFEGLKKAFQLYTDEKQFCGIGSVKSNIGHLYQAAGLASVIKAVLSLEHKRLAPTIHFDRPNRLMDFEESPFYFNNVLRDWDTEALPRRCGVSSFGLSGTNCHVILEEYTSDKQEEANVKEYYLVTISGKNEESLHHLMSKYQQFIHSSEHIHMGSLSFTANAGRGHYNERLAFIVKDQKDFAQKIDQVLAEGWKENGIEDVFYGKINEKVTVPQQLTPYLTSSIAQIMSKIQKLRKDESPARGLLSEICALYVTGADITWELLYEENERRVMSLPTYPFMRKRCWFLPNSRKTGYLTVNDDRVINDYEMLEIESSSYKEQSAVTVEENLDATSQHGIESTIIAAFKEVIGVDRVRLEDNFFELGGNSLKATKLASKIYELLEVLIPLSDILTYPTVGDFSNYMKGLVQNHPDQATQTIQVLPEQEFYDLSLMQEELWLSTQIYEDTSSMNITAVNMLHHYDVSILYKAFQAVVNRHQILKTRLAVINGVPKQTLRKSDVMREAYHYTDISHTFQVEQAIMQMINQDVSKAIDIENEPLIRITVAKVDADRHLFIFSIHHIISDWWSMSIIMNDLKKYYEAFSLGLEPDMQSLRIKYTDFAAWHREKVARLKEKLSKYWESVLQAPLPVLNLRTDYPRPLIKGQIGRKLEYEMDKNVLCELKSVADMHQGTMFMTLLSGVYTLLYMYSGQNDIILGTNSSGREHPQLQDQVGYYINLLPLRVHIEGNESYVQLFNRVKQTTLGALEHQDYPFVNMLDHVAIKRDSSRSPIFDVMVQLIIDSNKDDQVAGNNVRIEEISADSLEAKYDLVFNFFQRRNEIVLELEYSDSLFKEETINRMIKRLNRIFEKFSSHQEIPIEQLDIEDTREKLTLVKRKRG